MKTKRTKPVTVPVLRELAQMGFLDRTARRPMEIHFSGAAYQDNAEAFLRVEMHGRWEGRLYPDVTDGESVFTEVRWFRIKDAVLYLEECDPPLGVTE